MLSRGGRSRAQEDKVKNKNEAENVGEQKTVSLQKHEEVREILKS